MQGIIYAEADSKSKTSSSLYEYLKIKLEGKQNCLYNLFEVCGGPFVDAFWHHLR